ncbi:hypothetical protein [Streptomyces clavuligerus]|uniref:hypothetical protein n=1 Tax=Streptomyces clavuligerus TaxID=1901 RepID=UPI00020D94BE|nr:hypothetical protein [Streptomyces clavuligerus]ANW19420.1 hypothetical protein BB341_14935 [Streptomyces clavuligerus]AXU14027.1 hypothetical protein D1794_15580 [Streptomyces clavuligerus]MBY6304005.1 hypothetical protein [Streptomyces clavuligerus]QCS06800.1 hypothetical protein CRV15_14935 [Streptomyces clavuligerus]QPJ93846.1 hypothetical protein GE265_13100 [Streptomyces clavuligerus]
MITDRSPFGVPRPRVFRGPLHIVWLSVLTLALVFAHGVNRESPAHHFATASFSLMNSGHSTADGPERGGADGADRGGAATGDTGPVRTAAEGPGGPAPAAFPPPVPAAASHARLGPHSEGLAHPAEQCMPGQPQLNTTLTSPASEAAALGSARDRTARTAPPEEIRSGAATPACPPVTGILRI